MKELFTLLFSFKFKKLFFEPTENGLIKFFRYAFVGGIAFVVDYLFYIIANLLLEKNLSLELTVAIATTAGFIAGLTVNFLLSKKFVFTEKPTVSNAGGEFAVYAVIGVIGYFLNMGLMQLAIMYINKYAAKIIVAVIVLVYNYTARKMILYK